MAVRFETLTNAISAMGDAAAERREYSEQEIDDLLKKLSEHATNFKYIDLVLDSLIWNGGVDKQKYRAARHLWTHEPLDQGVPVPYRIPTKATIIAVDGSQAMPTRHAPYLYYLINLGWIVYHHGSGQAPSEFSKPSLYYVGDDQETTRDHFVSGKVSVERDKGEISTLARAVYDNKYAAAPILAILDQRLQYFPIGVNDRTESSQYVTNWIKQMETIKHAGGWLIGYIERPQTTAVVKLLQTLDIEKDGFDLSILNERPQIHDIDLFRRVLKAGERSAVFSVVNESTNYAPFREANQEICFFYYRPPGGDVSRVDMPKWLAQQEEVVEAIHALLQDQCLLLGNYPYVLTRADEIAVVRGSDREYLEHLIAGEMERRSIFGIMTGKQFGKELSRGGKGKHSL